VLPVSTREMDFAFAGAMASGDLAAWTHSPGETNPTGEQVT